MLSLKYVKKRVELYENYCKESSKMFKRSSKITFWNEIVRYIDNMYKKNQDFKSLGSLK